MSAPQKAKEPRRDGGPGKALNERLKGQARKWALPVGAAALLLLYPFYFESLAALPEIGDFFPSLNAMVYVVVFMMMAVGLNMVVGYAGLLDLGYVAFYAVGAYTAAWFASIQFEQVTFHLGSVGISKDLPGIHFSMWLVLIVAALFTMVAGILIGLPTLRLRGDYLAIVTLGFGEIIPQVARNTGELNLPFRDKPFDLTHGTFGISPIDSPGFGETLERTLGLPAAYRGAANEQELFVWTAVVLLLITVFCSVRLRDSRLGRAWIAIREDETAAAAMGVPLMRTKTWAYALGAFFGGMAGAYYASAKSGAFPSDFRFDISIFLLCMVILGGMGSIWGVLLGGLLLGYLNIHGLATIGSHLNEATGIDFEVPKYAAGIYGTIIVIVMLLRPVGLIPERRHKRELEEGVSDESFYGVQH